MAAFHETAACLTGTDGNSSEARGVVRVFSNGNGFAECAATGVWSCGTADDHLREASLVTKKNSTLGGALCCRD